MKEFLFAEELVATHKDIFIVKAENAKDAYKKAAKAFYKDDNIFVENIFDRTVNMSWAERFWIKTDHEQNIFCKTGEILIDNDEFKKRVKKYFSIYTKAADDYISFWFMDASDEEIEAAFKNLINNHSDFWENEWIAYTDFSVIDLSKVKTIYK